MGCAGTLSRALELAVPDLAAKHLTRPLADTPAAITPPGTPPDR